MSASAVEFASLGLAVDGLKIQIVNPESGELCGEREVGELRIAGNAVTSGYFHDEVATAEAFDGEWLRTGDLGYLVNNELVVCGRLSDVIIVGGRNLHPQDIERAAGAVDGVRTGNVIAFGVPGRQGAQNIVVVAEVRETATEMIRREIIRAVTESVGVPPKKIVLVVAGTVPKTSSGKLQRSLCRLRYQRGEFSE
jgi:fatty-acyl-CoA synthase